MTGRISHALVTMMTVVVCGALFTVPADGATLEPGAADMYTPVDVSGIAMERTGREIQVTNSSVQVTVDVGANNTAAALAAVTMFLDITANLDCVQNVSVSADAELATSGVYRHKTSDVVFRPGPNVTHRVLHELGHHVDISCEVYRSAPAGFEAASGVSGDWFDYNQQWSQVPAEVFAETVAETIAGTRPTSKGVVVTEAAKRLMTTWFTSG